MAQKFRETLKDPEKKAKLLFWIWVLSFVFSLIGYSIIFFMIFY
jgi:hypothetical protein